MLMRIIYINIAVFVVLRLVGLLAMLVNPSIMNILKWVEVSSDPCEVLYRPWTVLTYAFAHYDILHILFNMLWLYWLGRIFMDHFTHKQLAGLYILGALGGAVLYLLAHAILPALSAKSYMLGASASVLAIVCAMALYNPNYKIGLLFIGQISLKWVALFTVLIDLLSVSGTNAGGHIAHLGGALVGVAFAAMMRRGRDITAPLNKAIDKLSSLFTSKPRRGPGAPIAGGSRHTPPSGENHGRPTEADIDRVLDKIKRSGYSSLTTAERETLFRFSRKR